MQALQRITPCLWFDEQAEEAVDFYLSIFSNSKIVEVVRYGEAGHEIHGRTPGSVMTVTPPSPRRTVACPTKSTSTEASPGAEASGTPPQPSDRGSTSGSPEPPGTRRNRDGWRSRVMTPPSAAPAIVSIRSVIVSS